MSKKQHEKDTAEHVWLDYQGKTGPAQEFEHEGGHMLTRPSGDPIMIYPGLNKLEAARFDPFMETLEFRRRVADGSFTMTDEKLSGYATASALRELISRTWSADALEHIEHLEMAKPQAGPVAERRSQERLALIEKMLRRGLSRRVIDTAGMHTAAISMRAVG